MKHLRKSCKTYLHIILFIVITISIGNKCLAQDTSKVYGKWEIKNIVFVSPPTKTELNDIFKNCSHQKVIITESEFIFKENECFLYKRINNFKITNHYVLTLEDASKKDRYYDKTISYLFDNGKRKFVDAYKTNYHFKSDEGEVPELEIFMLDNNNIIINQDNNIVFLRREDNGLLDMK